MAQKSSTTQQSDRADLYALDKTFYPDTWADDTRMGVLLAEFRVRNVNPENYDSKMKFWKEMVRSYCQHKGSCVVSINALKEAFRRKGTVPYCLGEVFNDMIARGELTTKDEHMKHQPEDWTSWAVDLLVKQPLGWGFGKVKEKLSGLGGDDKQSFVCLDSASILAEKIETIIEEKDYCNKVISLEDLTNITKDVGIAEGSLLPVIVSLRQKKRLVVENLQSGDPKKILLKLASANCVAQPMTDLEKHIYQLECTEKEILKTMEKMEHNIGAALDLVKACIKDGRKQLAKSHLKKKHIMEKNLNRKMTALDNLQTMLSKIHDAQSDRNIIEAYKLGSNTLKNAYANSGITLDSVDDALAEVRESLEQHDEVQATLGMPQVDDIDELELEQELADLIDMKLEECNIPLEPVKTIADGVNIMLPANTYPTPTADIDRILEERLAAIRIPSPPPSVSSVASISDRYVSS